MSSSSSTTTPIQYARIPSMLRIRSSINSSKRYLEVKVAKTLIRQRVGRNTTHEHILCAQKRQNTNSSFGKNNINNNKTVDALQLPFDKTSPWKTALLCTAGGLLISTAGTLRYIQSQVNVGDDNNDGLLRSLSFYSRAVPLYARYRLLQMRKTAPQEEWDSLDEYASKVGLDKILELGGFYIKAGQMAASNIGNAFPKIWQNTMSVLQDDCPYKSFEDVRAIVEAEFGGKKLEDIFVEFETKPIGAASIGQVHRAKLRRKENHDSIEDVVVKIQYPEVEGLFRGDVRTMIMFCKVVQPVHVPALEEIEVQFMTEFDYRKEALQLNDVRENMMRAGFIDSVCEVPRPYVDLCTKNVLVMEYLDGQKLADGLQGDLERHAIRNGQTLAEFRAEQDEKDRAARVARVELMGPSAQEMDQYITLLDGKRRLNNLKAMLNNYLGYFFWWRAHKLPAHQEYESEHMLPLNHARLIDELLYIHGHQVLVDGYFNGDPHPGNILLLNKKRESDKFNSLLGSRRSSYGHGLPYRLGLIDYGQVKKITKKDRIIMCKLVIAMAEEDQDEVVWLMKETGYRSKNMDPDIMYKYCRVSFDEDNMKITNGMHIQAFMEYLDGADPVESLARDFIMISRVTVLLRGLAHKLHQSRSVAKAWKPIAERVLREEGL